MNPTGTNNPQDSLSLQQGRRWIVVFGLTVIVGVYAVPFFRTRPLALHEYVTELGTWQSGVFFFLCFTALLWSGFGFFDPRLIHLKFFPSYPPLWLAWLTGLLALAALDLNLGLGPEEYQASASKWIIYFFIPLLFVVTVRKINEERSVGSRVNKTVHSISLAELSGSSWSPIEDWLQVDMPGNYDFLNHLEVAKNLHSKLRHGVQSIGIVGRFGSGKSSI